MKRYVHGVASVAVAVAVAAGCTKQEAPPPTTAAPQAQPPQAQPPQAPPSTVATTPTAPMPPPDTPPGKDSTGPKPGQANDHSNPQFKEGGKPSDAK